MLNNIKELRLRKCGQSDQSRKTEKNSSIHFKNKIFLVITIRIFNFINIKSPMRTKKTAL